MDTRQHLVQLISGRRRGLWFARCSCGWEGEQRTSMEAARHNADLHQSLHSDDAEGAMQHTPGPWNADDRGPNKGRA